MLTLIQTLLDYPIPMLRAIAECNQVQLTTSTQPEMAGELSAALGDPIQIVECVEHCELHAREALSSLIQAGGFVKAPTFYRTAGEIRQGGPGWLAREQPWLTPANAAEILWYRALIGRTFATVEGEAGDYIYVPSDVLPWLPQPPPAQSRLRVATTPPPQESTLADNRLWQDMCVLLAFVQNEQVTLADKTWSSRSLSALNERLTKQSVENFDGTESERVHFLIALAESMGWFRMQANRLRLSAKTVRSWLAMTPAEQTTQLWQGWCSSIIWDDLRRVPTLRCEGQGWTNYPIETRERFLEQLKTLRPGVWFLLSDFVAAIKTMAPDFQRSDSIYTTWYIRQVDDPTYLLGFEHWDAIEGELVRFLVNGPLHWLGCVDLGITNFETNDVVFRVTQRGYAWMHDQYKQKSTTSAINVTPDFCVHVPYDASAIDHFRVARFASWQSSVPEFEYRITQTALRQAAQAGITPRRVLTFLRQATRGNLPANVQNALEKLMLH